MSDAREMLTARKHFLVTPQIELLYNEVQSWVWAGLTGGVIWGHPRIGKSESCKFIGHRIKSRSDSHVPYYYAPAKSSPPQSDQTFWTSLLISFRSPVKNRTSTWQCLRQLISLLSDAAATNHDKQIMICIDEAQYLGTKRYRYLIDLCNELQIDGIRPFVLLVGTSELSASIRTITGARNANIRGRFFARSMQFRGVHRKPDLVNILAHFDNPKHWGGEQSATEQCLSDTDWAGLSLVELAPTLWDAYRREVRDLGYSEWPMQYLMEAIRYLLLEGLPESTKEIDWHDLAFDAIQNSGIGTSGIDD